MRWIPYVKVLVHALCLLPFLWMAQQYRSGALALEADPVNWITHFTGNWALWILLASLAVTPVRRLHPSLANLIRFRRLLGLYAFFYATLHLSTYVFLFSGYDLPTVLMAVKAGHPGMIVEEWKVVWPTILGDLEKRRFIQVGLLAWLILLALALTSPAAVMRWLGGKNWQRLHRLVYVAAIAAVIHYLWLVKVGVREPWKDGSVLAVLLLARLFWVVKKRWQKPSPVPVSRPVSAPIP
jgi:sulfoxide reductase heme-binding subunit YedZ